MAPRPMISLEPEQIRKIVDGTILGKLYDEIVAAAEAGVLYDQGQPAEIAASIVTEAYNKLALLRIELPLLTATTTATAAAAAAAANEDAGERVK